MVTKSLVCLVKDDAADVLGGADSLIDVILHDLRSEEEDTPTFPETNTLFRRKIA